MVEHKSETATGLTFYCKQMNQIINHKPITPLSVMVDTSTVVELD